MKKKLQETKKSMFTELSSLGKLSSIQFKEFNITSFEKSDKMTLQYKTGESMQCKKDDFEKVIKEFYITNF